MSTLKRARSRIRLYLPRVLPTLLPVIAMLLGAFSLALSIMSQKQDALEKSLMGTGTVCYAKHDIAPGTVVRYDEAISCLVVQYRRDLVAIPSQDEEQTTSFLVAPVFATDQEGQMIAVIDIKQGQVVSQADFAPPPRVVPDTAIFVANITPVDPYSDIILEYSLPKGEEGEPVIPEYPEAQWLRISGKCLEVRENGCLFVITSAKLLGPHILLPARDNVLAEIPGDQVMHFLEAFARVGVSYQWYTNIPSLPEDRWPVLQAPPISSLPQVAPTPTPTPTSTPVPTAVPEETVPVSPTETFEEVTTPTPSVAP